MLLGPQFGFLEQTIFPDYPGFLILILPPGGFIVLGLILATKAAFDARKPGTEQEIAARRTERVFTAAGSLDAVSDTSEAS